MTTLNPRSAQPPFDVNLLTDYLGRGIGGSFSHQNNAGTGSTTVVAPASNTNGLVLRYLSMWSANDNALFAATSVPSSISDTAKRALFFGSNFAITLATPLYLPAGLGLYWYNNGATNRLYLGYDLL